MTRQYVFGRILLLLACFGALTNGVQAQEPQVPTPPESGAGWFLTLDGTTLLHSNHIGLGSGFSAGWELWDGQLRLGAAFYGRPGPINGHRERFDLPAGNEYKGQSSLSLGVDHGAFGLLAAPVFQIGDTPWHIEVPVVLGLLGAGFYLLGDDRITPDGSRTSVQENKLMGGRDASFSPMIDLGLRVRYELPDWPGVGLAAGVHYTYAFSWDTLVGGSQYFNIPRLSLSMTFRNP